MGEAEVIARSNKEQEGAFGYFWVDSERNHDSFGLEHPIS